MDIQGLFKSPVDRIAAFAQMQVLLYREDASLQDYFLQLQLDSLTAPRASLKDLRNSKRLGAWAVHRADQVNNVRKRRNVKADVLFCPMPYFGRQSENRFLIRALLGVAQAGATILCLMPDDAPCRAEIDDRLGALGLAGQVKFIDPIAPSNPFDARIRRRLTRLRAELAFEKTVSILEPHGLSPSTELRGGFEHLAGFVEAWERLAPEVEFGAVVARCHWHALCSPVCRTALQRGKPVITFQQGVIGHTLDVPVTSSKYVAFGKASASFLAEMNSRFFKAVNRPESSTEFIPAGSLFDNLKPLPDQFDRQTLLLVDVPIAQSDFYGVDSQCNALLDLADKLLTSSASGRRVVIRPHPFWNNLNFEACQRLVQKHPTRCEISHPVWSLEDDLRRSSVVAGIFSGVLTVAAACGVPTVFLQTEGGFATSDLDCFSQEQTLLPEKAFVEIAGMLDDRKEYERAREIALRNASEYYEGCKDADLNGEFFARLLSRECGNSVAQGATK